MQEHCPLRPAHVAAACSQWHDTPPLEFFVDFETVNDLDDDFSRIPRKGGQPLIFMIGCGHIENGDWRFECFIADRLSEPEEATAIAGWVDHMACTQARLAPQTDPKVIHWSSAEQSNLETAYNSAVARHPQRSSSWTAPNWFDLLKTVARAEPVVVKGAFGFGLKEMTNAMHNAGLIPTQWADGPADGRGAMVGAWSCQQKSPMAEQNASSTQNSCSRYATTTRPTAKQCTTSANTTDHHNQHKPPFNPAPTQMAHARLGTTLA